MTATLDEVLSALEAWVEALERADDDPDALEAAAQPPPRPATLAGWTASEHARAHRLGERMAALEARVGARRAEVVRALSEIAGGRRAPAPVFFDSAL